MINQLIADIGKQPVRVSLNWGEYDIKRRNADVEGLRERNSRLYDKLSGLAYDISGGKLNADHGRSRWKLQTDDMFELLAE